MDPQQAAADARIGQVLRGKWKLERVLGIGGMATVYAASHRNGLRGAVKILHAEVARDASARERFLREGYVANRVERGAVRVLDDDITEDGTVFLVMELLEGTTVEAMAANRPSERLEPKEVVGLALQLLDTLTLAHAAGIVHRDIKPENLFLTTTGELRVLDFGIARLREHAGVRATNTQAAMGTPAFMPPEQALARWEEVGPHSDLYSVGASMFTLLSGELTHEARTTPELLVAVATRGARPLASVMPGVSVGIAAVVDKALAHSPSNRFASAAEMHKELAFVASRLDLGADVSIDSAQTRAMQVRPPESPVAAAPPGAAQPPSHAVSAVGATLASTGQPQMLGASSPGTSSDLRGSFPDILQHGPSSGGPGGFAAGPPGFAGNNMNVQAHLPGRPLGPGSPAASSTTAPVSSGSSIRRASTGATRVGLGAGGWIGIGMAVLFTVGLGAAWRVSRSKTTTTDASEPSGVATKSDASSPSTTGTEIAPSSAASSAAGRPPIVTPTLPDTAPSASSKPSAAATAQPVVKPKTPKPSASSKPKSGLDYSRPD